MKKPLRRLAPFALALCAAGPVSAATDLPLPDWAFLEVGAADRGGSASALGMGWRLPWGGATRVGRFSTRLEAHVAHWSVPDAGSGRWRTEQLVLVPLLRHTWETTLGPLFVEGGIGASYLTDPMPGTSIRWNFHDTLAIGTQAGHGQRYEISLRLVHQSNAGLRQPNPGLNSLQLRLAAAF